MGEGGGRAGRRGAAGIFILSLTEAAAVPGSVRGAFEIKAQVIAYSG
jgi:hypothetical protein